MFDDINQSGDGGLYAELISNRAFQNESLKSWSAVGDSTLALDTTTPLSGERARPAWGTRATGGIDVEHTDTYTGSFYSYGEYRGSFTASLVSVITNETLAITEIKSKSVANAWTKHEFKLHPTKSAANSNNSFVLEFRPSHETELKFNLISLFPPQHTTTGRTNTDGLGLVEYMHWAEDLGVDVVLGVAAGLYLNGDVVPEEELDFFVQDALNELEFLMGDVSTPYGALRAKLGYPRPWRIKFVMIEGACNLD
ncbi:hypothetical protein L209DRAFT_745172 [Thermothelomyces heterothallicus CBS 203.75]